MRKERFITALLGFVITLTAVQSARALCREGRRVMAVQNSDIRLEPGTPAYLPVPIFSFDLANTAGSIEWDCGLVAKSELPGLSVISSYGPTPPLVSPPGVWSGIGASTSPSLLPALDTFSILFDGTAPAGVQGRIIIGVKGDDFGSVFKPIGSINIYVGHYNRPSPTWFTVVTDEYSVVGNSVVLDHPLINGNRGAKLFVTHVYNPAARVGPRYWNHPIMTSYQSSQGRWFIKNVDGATMPVGLGFNVRIDHSALQYYTGQPATSPPVSRVVIDDPVANNNRHATIAVSMTGGVGVFNAGEGFNAHPIAVRYNKGRWEIVNSDGALIPAGVRFNVRVLGYTVYHDGPQEPRLDLSYSNSAGLSYFENRYQFGANVRPLHFWWQLGQHNRELPMLVTPNLTPLGLTQSPGGKYVGLRYLGVERARWGVIYEDQSVMPLNAAFNILARPQPLVP